MSSCAASPSVLPWSSAASWRAFSRWAQANAHRANSQLIHEWKNTICVTSKYKDDLVHIRDMHRLLSYKGYRFKAFDAARAMASSNPNEVNSAHKLSADDRT